MSSRYFVGRSLDQLSTLFLGSSGPVTCHPMTLVMYQRDSLKRLDVRLRYSPVLISFKRFSVVWARTHKGARALSLKEMKSFHRANIQLRGRRTPCKSPLDLAVMMASPNNLSIMLHSTARSTGRRSRTKYLLPVVSSIRRLGDLMNLLYLKNLTPCARFPEPSMKAKKGNKVYIWQLGDLTNISRGCHCSRELVQGMRRK